MPRLKTEKLEAPLEVKRMLYSLTRSKAVLQRLQEMESREYAPLLVSLLMWAGREELPTLKALQQATWSTPVKCRK
jgi:hypothetical protein